MAKQSEAAEKILAAAISLWSDKGYDRMTMRELAVRASMGASSLYGTFGSKQEIVQYLYERLHDDARERYAASPDDSARPMTRLVRFVRIKLDLLRPHRTALPALLREAVDPGSSLSPMSAESGETLRRNLAFFSGLVPGDVSGGAGRILWTVHIALLLYWLHDRSSDQERTEALLSEIESLPIELALMASETERGRRLLDLLTAVIDPPDEPAAVEASDSEAGLAREVDVVVIGGGPIGCLYASFLKQQRPATHICVLEKSPEPGHKIGESTLSGYCKALRSVGIPHSAMQELFYPKNGLGFFHLEERTPSLQEASEYILETFDETFQVERRVLDELVLENTRRLGVEVIQGAEVELRGSRIGAEGCVVSYRIGPRDYRVRARLVVDASGPAHLIARENKLWTGEGLPFQTSSVWSYWSGVKPLAAYEGWGAQAQFPRDEYTQHFCFRQGWLWYIPLVSWEHAPRANLTRGLRRLLGKRGPSRGQLESVAGCPTADVVSIGLTLRSDRDEQMSRDPKSAFETYLDRYPALAQVLSGATLIAEPYAGEPPFAVRRRFRGHARRVAGDGWLAVGDAAFFVDPLISPGLTSGAATAYRASVASARALDAGVTSEDIFADYQAFAHELHRALERDNQLVYMSFNRPDTLALIQRFQEVDARRHFLAHLSGSYSDADTDVWGILNPAYQEMQKKAWACMREAEERQSLPSDEQSSGDYETMQRELEALLGGYLVSNRSLNPYAVKNPERG